VSHRLLVGQRPANLREALPVNVRGVVRWRRVFVWAVVALVAAIVIGAVAVLSFTSRTPYEAGRLVGTIALPASIAGGTTSYLAQRGVALPLRIVMFVGIVAAIPALGSLAELAHGHAEITEADRVALVDDGARLHHPTFGFSIAKPAGFVDAPERAKELNPPATDVPLPTRTVTTSKARCERSRTGSSKACPRSARITCCATR
jgi:hypothetical protein